MNIIEALKGLDQATPLRDSHNDEIWIAGDLLSAIEGDPTDEEQSQEVVQDGMGLWLIRDDGIRCSQPIVSMVDLVDSPDDGGWYFQDAWHDDTSQIFDTKEDAEHGWVNGGINWN